MLDLKHSKGVDVLLQLTDRSDVLLEGFRPGVAERLGFGPDVCRARNPRLVYGRMTGFGQTGAWSGAAGHDLNYVALAGALWSMGSKERPIPPLNLIGDFGGGGLLLAFGLVSALLERASSGDGQVIDAAMVDGASLLMTMFHELIHRGMWTEDRGANLIDGGTWYYDAYETADGEWISCAAVEPEFRHELLTALGLEESLGTEPTDPVMRNRMATAIRRRTRSEWEERLGRTDACFAPVLRPTEMWDHEYHQERRTFVEVDGVREPAPAPRFSRTPPPPTTSAPLPGEHTLEILEQLGLSDEAISEYLGCGAVRDRRHRPDQR
jgi:alpha-methylacyl-CoA racemase